MGPEKFNPVVDVGLFLPFEELNIADAIVTTTKRC